jgi:hypothetical protein
MANLRRDAAKERFWRDAVKRQAASRLSVRAFCQREKLTECTFYAWRRTLAQRSREAVPAVPAPAFVPMRVADRVACKGPIEIELAGGRVLRLPEAIAAERLAELVEALEACQARGGR